MLVSSSGTYILECIESIVATSVVPLWPQPQMKAAAGCGMGPGMGLGIRLFWWLRKAARVERLPGNPIIHPGILPGDEGSNINGPSLIEAPDWLPQRLARFYLYFAHHDGQHIRLALADDLGGPWRIHAPGTLQLADAPGCRGHIASPDVHVDAERRRIVMYFHGPATARRGQHSFVATSTDGLHFTASADPIASFYLRAVRWREGLIGMAKGGFLYTAPGWDGPFEPLGSAFPVSDRKANAPGDVRHVALACHGDRLTVLFTRIGDAPERVLRAEIDLSQPRERWRAGRVTEIISPELDWEGANLPRIPSRAGAVKGPENALRDPAIFSHSGATYLIYAVAGESGLAIARLPAGLVTGG